MRQAYRLARKDNAVGVDGQTAKDYLANLDENFLALLEKTKSGQYRAPPVRRMHIPKGSSGATRLIGIPTFGDKLLQRAVAMVLESVYEQDILDCSYGFRPKRGAIMAALIALHCAKGQAASARRFGQGRCAAFASGRRSSTLLRRSCA